MIIKYKILELIEKDSYVIIRIESPILFKKSRTFKFNKSVFNNGKWKIILEKALKQACDCKVISISVERDKVNSLIGKNISISKSTKVRQSKHSGGAGST